MIKTRGRKIYRDIAANKLRSTLVIISIFVGVLGIAVLTTMGHLLTRQLDRDLVSTEMAMLRLYLSPDQAEPIDNTEPLMFWRRHSAVTAAEGQAVYEIGWRLPDQNELQRGQVYAYSEPFGQIEIEPIRLLRGRFPKPFRREVAIERRMADKLGLDINDKLVIRSATFGDREWNITGIVFQPYIYFGDTHADDNVYMNYDDAQNVVGFEGFSSIYVRFTSFATAQQHSYDLRNAFNQQTQYTISLYLLENPDNNPFVVGVNRFRNVLLILSVLAMAVASFLVTNVFSIVMTEQQRQIGAMKAIGATRADVLFIYIGMAMVYGAIGTFFGLFFGIPLGHVAAHATAPLANTIITEVTLPPIALWSGLALGIGIPVLAALIPILSGSRITVLEAMSDFGIAADYRPSRPVRFLFRIGLPFIISHTMKNILRRKSRLALSFVALTLAVTAFMGMLATFNALNRVIQDIRSNLNVSVNFDLRELQILDVVNTLMISDADEVRSISPGVAIQLEVVAPLESDTLVSEEADTELVPIIVTGIDTAMPLKGLVYVDGEGWINNPDREGIVISQEMAQLLNRNIGDNLTLVAPENSQEFEIIGIADYPIESAFMEWQQLASFVGTLRDAPEPNRYWEPLRIGGNGAPEDADIDVWAVGVDETVGKYLSEAYVPEGTGIIISQSLASAGGYEVGDEITLQPRERDVLSDIIEEERSYPILAIVNISQEEQALFQQTAPEGVDTDNGIIAMDWSQLATLVGLDYADITPETFRIDLAAPEQGLLNNIDSTRFEPIAVYTNEVGFADRVAQTILGIGVVMNLASLLMAVVGGIGLLTITMVGVWERQREIGVMRTLGATTATVFAQFLIEGIIIGVLAWLVGIPLSYLLTRLLLDTVPFHEVIRFRYSLMAPIAGLVGMVVVTVLATLYPALRASKRTVSEILRYA